MGGKGDGSIYEEEGFMRSRATNILQVVVLITGVVYIVLGVVFYWSPLHIIRIFAVNVSESWLELVRDNELIAPLYQILRAYAALVLTSGVAMIMPLFDPLRYRGLIYYNGLFFPALASLILGRHSLYYLIHSNASHESHSLVFIMAGIFLVVALLNVLVLIYTKKSADRGEE